MRRALVTVGLVLTCAVIPPPASASAFARHQGSSQTALDQLLAPIALYPDQLLAQVLMSASSPAKMSALHEWMLANPTLKGTALQDAAVKAGFDASFVALVLFPQVVTMMAEQPDWTTQLGQAFASDRSAVFDSIQRLRKKAKDVGTLKTTKQQEVNTQKTSSGQDVIVIEPSNPQVVYVPQYNPQVVYTQAPTTSTVIIQEDDDDTAEAVAAGIIGFTAGVAIGAAVNNNYYYGPYGWGGGAYMYNDAWDDYYDHREDAREDYMDHREDVMEERGDRAENAREERTDRQQTSQQERTDRTQARQENRPESAQRGQRSEGGAAATTAQSDRRSGNYEARGHADSSRAESTRSRSGGGSDAFSGYSNGRSERASSSRGQSSRSGGGRSGGGRSGGGGRRR